MVLEHIGINVSDAAGMAAWYCEHLGLSVSRQTETAWFLADSTGRMLLEIYTNPAVKQIDYAALEPGSFHIAFVSDDVAADRGRLIEAGGSADGEIFVDGGDEFAIVRDPWGVAVQLAKRGTPMV
jgi:glyoxylase I family protein